MYLIPREMREPMSRALGYLKRQDLELAMTEMSAALRTVAHAFCPVQVQKAIAREIQTFLAELEKNPRIRNLVQGCVAEGENIFPYRPGQETTLSIVLDGLVRILQKEELYAQAMDTMSRKQKRRETLFQTAVEYLKASQTALAQAFFVRLVVEFPDDEEIWREPARLLEEAGCRKETLALCEVVLEQHPRQPAAYSEAIRLCMELKEYSRAEHIFQSFIRTFGGHPRTYAKFARLYLEWGRWDQARSMAEQALSRDPDLKEAADVLDALRKAKDDEEERLFSVEEA